MHNYFQWDNFVKFIRYLALPIWSVQCDASAWKCTKSMQILLIKMKQVLQKWPPKSVRKVESGRGLKDLLSWNWVPVFAQILCKMDVAREMRNFYTHWFSGLTGRQTLLVGQWLRLWNDLPSNEGERHAEGDSPSQGGGREHLGASPEMLMVFLVRCCPCRYIWCCFLDILFCSLAKW